MIQSVDAPDLVSSFLSSFPQLKLMTTCEKKSCKPAADPEVFLVIGVYRRTPMLKYDFNKVAL